MHCNGGQPLLPHIALQKWSADQLIDFCDVGDLMSQCLKTKEEDAVSVCLAPPGAPPWPGRQPPAPAAGQPASCLKGGHPVPDSHPILDSQPVPDSHPVPDSQPVPDSH
jgi:hypothetical protein